MSAWTVTLDTPLPPHLVVADDEDLVTLRCRWCGWRVVFAVGGLTGRELARLVAEEHLVCDASC